MKGYLNKKGFSLIELIVVIAIIAILSAVIITNITSSRSKARDAKRISDIANIQLALEQFFDRCRRYPGDLTISTVYNSGSTPTCLSSTDVRLSNFISVLPTAPSPGTYEYSVRRSDYYDYVLKATLENPGVGSNSGNPLPETSSPSTGGSDDWSLTLSCSNASNSTSYCVGPK